MDTEIDNLGWLVWNVISLIGFLLLGWVITKGLIKFSII